MYGSRMGTGSGRGPVRRVWLTILACVLLALTLPTAASAATITVTSLGDSAANDGLCTLREAIVAANTNLPSGALPGECPTGQPAPSADTIDFSVSGTISPGAGGLPVVTSQVTLNGTAGCTGMPTILLNGAGAGAGTNGIELDSGSSNSEVCGFAIQNFAGSGVAVESDANTVELVVARDNGGSGIAISGGDSNVVRTNRVGTNPTGTAADPNAFGVSVGGSNSQNNVIGGGGASDGNLISGNSVLGVLLEGTSTGTRIEGNEIGTDVTGSLAIPNGQQGIRIGSSSTANLVGGDASGEGNLISGNNLAGLQLQGADANVVQGNFIGTDVSGTAAVGNGQGASVGAGVEISGTAIDN